LFAAWFRKKKLYIVAMSLVSELCKVAVIAANVEKDTA